MAEITQIPKRSKSQPGLVYDRGAIHCLKAIEEHEHEAVESQVLDLPA